MLKNILTGLSVVLLVLAGSTVLLFNWSATGWKALSVPTGSMRPAIPQSSLVFTHKVPISSLRVGDVITYVNPFNTKQTISHRIVKTYTIAGKIPAFVTKGDANKVADVPITEGSVVGKVVGHVPSVGAWLLRSKKPVALIPLIYIPAVLLMIEEVQRLSEYYKLAEPYRLRGFGPQTVSVNRSKFAAAGAICLVFTLSAAAFWQPALALLQSSPVALTSNTLSVAAKTPTCQNKTTTNNTTVTVNNSSSQTATSGSATSTSSTTGGTATSGNASNTNSTTTTVTVKNGC